MSSKELITKLLSIKGVGRQTAIKIFDSITFDISSEIEFIEYVLEFSQTQSRIKLSNELVQEGISKAKAIISKSEKKDIHLIDFRSKDYPSRLLEIKDFPLILSCKGNIEILNDKAVAIIGTREPTSYGRGLGIRLGNFMAESGYVVVSGLAKGCDTAAHEGCLKANGKTIAVLAHGLDMIYPKENEALANEITDKGGLLVTEYFVGTKPLANFFVNRDRIQAGLSDGLFVVETGLKGGSLHTVKYSNEYRRPVFAFNHPPEMQSLDKSQGNQMLIKSGDANPFFDSNDLVDIINKISSTENDNAQSPPEDKKDRNFIQGTLW